MSKLTEILRKCLGKEFEDELDRSDTSNDLEDLVCSIEKSNEEADEIAGEKYRAELRKQGLG